jgi:cardiolipin synthase
MLRRPRRRPRKPKTYRIPVEVYLATLAVAVVLSMALSILSRPHEVDYLFPHRFGVHDGAFLPSAHALANPVMVTSNRITLLENGDEIFPSMLAAISSARESVNLESYIFWSGDVANRFIAALTERARHGVEIRVLLDALGSGPKLREEDRRRLVRSGCTLAFFHPVRPWMLDAINHRTHRRVLVVDGRVGFTGGAGIADEWVGNADAPAHWRETHVRVEGPVVAQLQALFQENWSEVRGEALVGPKFFPRLEPAGDSLAQVVPSSWNAPSSATKLLYAVAISAARRRLLISNSYFLPDDETRALLIAAAGRGVDVEILVPGKVNDVPATKAGGRSSFGALLSGGVKIFEYGPTMFHPKTMVVDGVFATVGSTNFDNRSFRLNDEINLTMYDAVLGARLERMFDADRARSRPYTLEDHRRRSVRDRLFEWVTLPLRREL